MQYNTIKKGIRNEYSCRSGFENLFIQSLFSDGL